MNKLIFIVLLGASFCIPHSLFAMDVPEPLQRSLNRGDVLIGEGDGSGNLDVVVYNNYDYKTAPKICFRLAPGPLDDIYLLNNKNSQSILYRSWDNMAICDNFYSYGDKKMLQQSSCDERERFLLKGRMEVISCNADGSYYFSREVSNKIEKVSNKIETVRLNPFEDSVIVCPPALSRRDWNNSSYALESRDGSMYIIVYEGNTQVHKNPVEARNGLFLINHKNELYFHAIKSRQSHGLWKLNKNGEINSIQELTEQTKLRKGKNDAQGVIYFYNKEEIIIINNRNELMRFSNRDLSLEKITGVEPFQHPDYGVCCYQWGTKKIVKINIDGTIKSLELKADSLPDREINYEIHSLKISPQGALYAFCKTDLIDHYPRTFVQVLQIEKEGTFKNVAFIPESREPNGDYKIQEIGILR